MPPVLTFLLSFLLSSWRAVRSYQPHLEGRDAIWGDDWSYSPFIRRSPSWGFLGFSSAVRQMPGDLCTAPRIISSSPLSLAINVTDATLGASYLWLGIRTGAGGTTLTKVLAAAHGSMDNRSYDIFSEDSKKSNANSRKRGACFLQLVINFRQTSGERVKITILVYG